MSASFRVMEQLQTPSVTLPLPFHPTQNPFVSFLIAPVMAVAPSVCSGSATHLSLYSLDPLSPADEDGATPMP